MKTCADCGGDNPRPRAEICLPCSAKRTRSRTDPARIKAWKRSSYQRHREEILAKKRTGPRALVPLHVEPGQPRPACGTNEYKRAWALANAEKTLASKRAWAERNREKTREKNAQYRAQNPDKRRETVKAWAVANPDKVKKFRRDGMRRAYRRNPEKFRIAAQAYMRSKGTAYASWVSNRRRARKLSAPGSGVGPDQWSAMCREYDHRCAYCGKLSRLEREHVVPLFRGGADDVTNVVPSCRSCNASKGTKLVSEWIQL